MVPPSMIISHPWITVYSQNGVKLLLFVVVFKIQKEILFCTGTIKSTNLNTKTISIV